MKMSEQRGGLKTREGTVTSYCNASNHGATRGEIVLLQNQREEAREQMLADCHEEFGPVTWTSSRARAAHSGASMTSARRSLPPAINETRLERVAPSKVWRTSPQITNAILPNELDHNNARDFQSRAPQ
jgi:hypothetical protein